MASMRVRVRYFGPLKAQTGCEEEPLELPEGAAVSALLDACGRLHPALAASRPSLLVAVEREFAGPDTLLRPGQEIALMPPLSGG